jgi:outer membrane protein assembly factor BamB
VFYPTGFATGQLFAIKPDGRGDVTGTHVVWRVTRGVPNKPSLVLSDDLLFMVNDAGILSCLDATKGTEVWKARLEGSFSASPVLAGGRIYFFSEEGKTTVIEAGRAFKVLAENHLGDGFMASPAIDGGALILRSRTHLYRIESADARRPSAAPPARLLP